MARKRKKEGRVNQYKARKTERRKEEEAIGRLRRTQRLPKSRENTNKIFKMGLEEENQTQVEEEKEQDSKYVEEI